MGNKNKKVLFLTDIETGLEPILQKETNIHPENMLMIQSYGPIISHPYGDIMRSIILAIYNENVEEIYVVGTKNNRNITDVFQSLQETANKNMNEKVKTVDYLFRNCKPEFFGDSVSDWLNVSEDIGEKIKKNVEIISHHPLVPSHVKVHGLVVNKHGDLATVNK